MVTEKSVPRAVASAACESGRCRKLRSLPLAVLIFLTLLFPQTSGAHDPITTKVMFNKEIVRIFQRSCLECHSVGKIKADIPLSTYEEARPWAKAIKEEVLEKRMMPYQAVKGYGAFQHDYTLAQRDIELIVSWVEGGAPRGEERDYPKEAIEQIRKGENWTLGQPDLILAPEKATEVAAEGDDEVRCFDLPVKAGEDRWITAFDFHPGNGAVVYSAAFFIERTTRKVSGRNNDNCGINSETKGLENLGIWIPGQVIDRLPEGTGRLLPANSRVLLKIRYRKNGEATTDRSRLGLYFAKNRIDKAARTIIISSGIGSDGKTANTDNARVQANHILTEPKEIIAIRPILFPLAESIEARAYRPDGTIEVLIWAKKYRYDWQPTYYLRKPLALPKGTRIEVTAYLNSAENNADKGKSPDVLCEIILAANSERTSQLRPGPRRG
jgi:hypothetical protein